jgi:uncharacterized protein YndB with AHSA1/START domain
MKCEHTVRYDAPVDQVYAMLTDPAFREKASWAQGTTKVDVSVAGGKVEIDMLQPNTDIPSFAKAIAGETTRAIQTEEWRDGTTAAFSVASPGKPVAISGTRTLQADGEGTLDTFTGEAKAKVPLVGGKIEKLVVEKLKEGWDVEHGVGVAWLGGER